jgi:hypothetical protein
MVRISVMAFDKNTNAFVGETISTDSKEDFNQKYEEFEKNVPFSKYYIEVEPVSDLTEQEMEIIEDYYTF